MGFAVPLTAWLRGPLEARAERLLGSSALESVGIDPSAARAEWKRFASGRAQHPHQIWNLFAIAAWAERWQPQPAAATLASP